MDSTGSTDDSDPETDFQLFRAIGGLPHELREVTRLVFVERRSEAEAAELLDLSVEDVKRRLAESRQILVDAVDVEELRKRLR